MSISSKIHDITKEISTMFARYYYLQSKTMSFNPQTKVARPDSLSCKVTQTSQLRKLYSKLCKSSNFVPSLSLKCLHQGGGRGTNSAFWTRVNQYPPAHHPLDTHHDSIIG